MIFSKLEAFQYFFIHNFALQISPQKISKKWCFHAVFDLLQKTGFKKVVVREALKYLEYCTVLEVMHGPP